MRSFLLFALAWTAVSALPNPALPPANVCKDVNAIVNALHLYPSASSFCSSFIKIPVVTSTSTKVVGTTTVYTATTTNTVTQSTVVTSTLAAQASSTTTVATVTSTAFVTEATTATSVQVVGSTTTTTVSTTVDPVTSTSTKTITATSTQYPHFNQRRAEIGEHAKRALPPQLTKYASAALSTGCSCLNLPTSTSTTTTSVTQTVNAVSTATATTVAPSVVTVTSTTTQIYTTTAQTTITNTRSSSELDTITSTNIITSTVTQTITPTNTQTVTTTVLGATTTATADPCNPSNAVHYTNGDGNPFHGGDSTITKIQHVVDTPQACCRECYAGTNCAYVFFVASQFGNECYYLSLGNGYPGSPSATCPKGVAADATATGQSAGFMDSDGQNFMLGPCFAGGRQ